MSFADQTLYVVGLGLSGKACIEYLHSIGAHVFGWDDDQQVRNSCDVALWDPAVGRLPENCSGLFLSPGIAHKYPTPHLAAKLALDQQCPIMCDIVLLCDHSPDANLVCITGTNGKSTLTSLLHHVADTMGLPCAAGGNLGPAAAHLPPLPRAGWYAIEASSYQCERIPDIAADIAINLNISADHLDRYATMDEYVAAKAQLFAQQGADSWAIIGVDDKLSNQLYQDVLSRVVQHAVPISGYRLPKGGIGQQDGWLIDDCTGQSILKLDDVVQLQGWHNAQNLAACWAAAKVMGCDVDQFAQSVLHYQPLAHRQTLVRKIHNVRFVNDSKATNTAACAASISAYQNVHLIAGGIVKESDLSVFSTLGDHLVCVYCIGKDGHKIAQACKDFVDVVECETLKQAFDCAWAKLAPTLRSDDLAQEQVVLLAPAGASFDQFDNFGHRGKVFADLVMALPKPELCEN